MSPSWIRGGMEVEILKVDERPLEPIVTVRVLATNEVKEVEMGKLTSSSGDIEIWQQADEIIREEKEDD